MNIQNQDMPLLSNSMAAYAHIRGNPESFGLYFVVGVCFGLVLTLCLLVIHISLQPRSLSRKPCKSLRDFSEDEEEEEEDEDEEEDTVDCVTAEPPLAMTELAGEAHATPEGTLTVNVFASAEELERAQRLEERERILREIWRNGQPDILGAEYFAEMFLREKLESYPDLQELGVKHHLVLACRSVLEEHAADLSPHLQDDGQ